MGFSYSAGVFFGACVERDSALGQQLDEYIDRQGGTLAETGTTGVLIDSIGDEGAWLTVQAEGSQHSYGRNEGECPDPLLLTEGPTWRPAIREFLSSIGAPPEIDVGWHFQGSVS